MRRLVWILLALVVASCGGKKTAPAGKPRIAVSIFPLYDVTKRIAGDRFDVVLVLPPGTSEHGYTVPEKDKPQLQGAALVITVGLDLDAWADATAPKQLRVGQIVKTTPIDVEPLEPDATGSAAGSAGSAEPDDIEDREDHVEDEPTHDVGSPDPHVWMDPQRMTTIVDAIAAELAGLDAAHKDTFTKNADAINASLKDLDDKLTARSKAWSKHTIVTFHGSHAYFAARYGLVVAAVVEPQPGNEPSATYRGEVVEAINANHATAVFSEPQLASQAAQQIAAEAKVPLGELDVLGGVPGRDSYEALLTWNADQLEKLLR